MHAYVLRVCLIGLAFFPLGWEARAAEEADRVVLRVGQHCVSAKTVGKYLARHSADAGPGEKTADFYRSWMENFLARHVVIADLKDHGYLLRSEVCADVARMERHMLTASYGPFYDRVVARGVMPAGVGEVLERSSQRSAVLDGVVFASREDAREHLGGDFAEVSDAEKARRLTLCSTLPGASRVEGNTYWWDEPYHSVIESPSSSFPGSWFLGVETDAGFAFFKIVSVVGGEDLRSPTGPERMSELRRIALCHAHRKERLTAAQFRLETDSARRLVEALHGPRAGANRISPDLLPEGAVTPLFSYATAKGRVSITLGEFADYYNGLYVRRIPDSVTELRVLGVDMVIGRLDLASPEAAEIAQSASFLRDKQDFAELIALSLYERESLLPRVRLAEEEIAAYYQAHLVEFSRPTAAHGWLVWFSTLEEAGAWMRAAGPTLDERVLLGRSAERVTYESAKALLAFESQRPLIFDPSVANVLLGPTPSGSGFAVFYKLGSTDSAAASLEEVRPQIVFRLQQKQIEALERAAAIKLCGQYEVQDALVPAEFGITGDVHKPWTQ